MNEKLISLIFNTVSVLGSVGIATFALLQYGLNYNDRKLKERTVIAKETSVGEAAIEKLLEAQKTIRTDIESLEKGLETMKVEMFNEKKDLQNRLEKLRDHFEDMTKDYFKILANK